MLKARKSESSFIIINRNSTKIRNYVIRTKKMRYIRRYMEDNSRTDIEQVPLKAGIESIFSEENIDEDCDTIASLLSPY